jgi:ABC-type antimicrobial peptide transport system permease subunit
MLSGFFGTLALLLAAIGLYGLTSYGVNRRRGEIGIRMALGAAPNTVIVTVLRQVAILVSAGILAGTLLSWWMARFVAPALLYGLKPRDPLTIAGAALVLLAVGALAGWLPARRAARIDPAQVLREA